MSIVPISTHVDYSMSIPNEISEMIFSHLSPAQLLEVSLVCQTWSAVSRTQELWKKFVVKKELQHLSNDYRATMLSYCKEYNRTLLHLSRFRVDIDHANMFVVKKYLDWKIEKPYLDPSQLLQPTMTDQSAEIFTEIVGGRLDVEDFEDRQLPESVKLRIFRHAITTNARLLNRFSSLRDNEEAVYMAVQYLPMGFSFASERLRADKKFVERVVSFLGVERLVCRMFSHVDTQLRQDRSFIVDIARKGLICADNIGMYVNDEEIVAHAVATRGVSLRRVAEVLRDKKYIVLAAVRQDGDALQYASERLQDDEEVVTQAVLSSGISIQYASQQWRQNKATALKAVANNPDAFEFLDPSLQGDEEIIFTGLMKDCFMVRYLPDTFHAKREFVLQTVRRDGDLLQKFSDRFRADEEIALAAGKGICRLQGSIHPSLWSSKSFLKALLPYRPCELQYACDELKRDKELLLIALAKAPIVFDWVPEDMRRDEEILRILAQHGYLPVGDQVTERLLLGNPEFVRLSLMSKKGTSYIVNAFLCDGLPEEFKNDRDVAFHIAGLDGGFVRFFSEEILKDREVAMRAVTSSGDALQWLPYFQDDEEIVKIAVRRSCNALEYASERLKREKDILALAISLDSDLLDEIDQQFIHRPDIMIAWSEAFKEQ